MVLLVQQAVEILDFWFGELLDNEVVKTSRPQLWFDKNTEVDNEIKDRFGALLLPAKNGKLAWQGTPKGRLAMILLLDQFSRNIFRGTAEAFAYDAAALPLALEGIAAGADRQCGLFGRSFYYLPLEHAEDLALQQRSVALFKQLAEDAPEQLQSMFTSFYDYAIRHRDIVERFGRFPHRNVALERLSTEEELGFLQQPGSSF